MEIDFKQSLMLEHLNASLQRAKTIPELKTLLNDLLPSKTSPTKQKDSVESIIARFRRLPTYEQRG